MAYLTDQHAYTPEIELCNSKRAEPVGTPSNDTISDDEDGLENGSRKRKRPINVSCELCKSRKVKCDRAQPACGWCSRNDQRCEYREKKKPGLRAGYGKELEGRIDRLEAMIIQQSRQLEAHLSEKCSPTTPAAFHHDSLTHSHQPSQADLTSAVHHQNVDQSDFHRPGAILAPSPSVANNYSQSPYDTHSRVLAVSELVGHTPADPKTILWNTSTTAIDKNPPAQVPTAFENPRLYIPPQDLQYDLVKIYFQHVDGWLPLLHRETTLEALFGSGQMEEGEEILLHAIVAISLRFSSDVRLTPETRERYHDFARQRVQLYGIENSNVRALQALVILAFDITGSSNGPPGWNLVALIARSVVQLGLSVESTSSLVSPVHQSIATLRAVILAEPVSWIEDEERRRLFWSVYLLDRHVTIATAFEFALDEKEIDRRLPCKNDLFNGIQPVQTWWFARKDQTPSPADNMASLGWLAHYCELLHILSGIHQFLKRPVDIGSQSDVEKWQSSYRNLENELSSWHFQIPSEYANISGTLSATTAAEQPTSVGWIMLHATFYTTVIRLHSSAAYPTSTSPHFNPSYSAMQNCLAAVENIRQLAEHVVDQPKNILDRIGPPFAFSLWVATRLLLVHGSTMEHKIDPVIGFFVSGLAKMGRIWDIARRYSEVLSRVLDEYQQSERAVARNGEQGRATPSTVKILADMRRCAYDLDLLISRAPCLPQNAKAAAKTPRSRTPAPHEFEYLDVFNSFNLPRLPFFPNTMDTHAGQHAADGNGSSHADAEVVGMAGNGTQDFAVGAIDYGISGFLVPDPDADWLLK